jgi:hypothetical protein
LGGGKGTSTSTQAPPKEIMEAYKQSLDLGRQAISQPYQQYQGQLVAGLNPTQLQGISNVNAAQGAALPYIQQGASYANQAAQGVNPGMINQFMSPYLNNVVNATQRNLLESNAQQQAALKSGAIQAGAFGGDRSRFAQSEMARQQGLAGGQVIGGLLNQGFGQALAGAQQNVQNMMQGGQMLGGLGMSAQQSILQGAQAQMAAGAQQQATEQAGLQALYDQFLQRQAYPYQQAQFFANIAQGIGAGAGGTTSQTPAAPSWGSQVLGGLTAIGSIFSDERVKENIVEVGETHDGQKIYKYNYKGDSKPQIGLIAQEVEKTKPEAVSSLGGIKMVDYDKATEGSERQGKAFGGSSMGGLVTPDMQRQAFAQGGFGMVPYSDFMKGLAYVPSGELTYRGQSPGSTFPKGFSPEELERIANGSDFDPLNAMSEKQIAGLKSGFGKLGTSLGLSPTSDGADGVRAPTYSGPLSSFGPGVGSFFSSVGSALGFADGGGVVPRHGYATDGAVEEESPLPPFLVQAESGGNTQADNSLGYVGRGQFGEDRLTDAKRAGVIPPDLTLEQFKNDPGVQKAVEAWHVSDVNTFIKDRGLGAFVGKEINGVPVTEQGLLAVAHLGGKGGMEKFLKSGGRYNPSDANGTSLMDYLALAADNSGGVVPAQDIPSPSGVVPQDLPPINAKVTPASDDAPARSRTIIENILGQDLSDQARTGMLAAGLAMLGGRSPYFGVNVGKGGLAGLQAYYSGLANERELAKMGAELDLRGYEAQTGRMQAETAREQMVRQLYMQILPLVQFYQAEGRPIPPQYQKIIDEATSLGVAGDVPAVAPAERPAPAEGAAPAPAPAGEVAPVTDVPAPATEAQPVTEPVAGEPVVPAAVPETETAPAPAAETAVPNANPELARLFSQLPDDQNPYKLLEKAGRAMTFDMKKGYTDQANTLMQQYRENGIPLPSGTVLFPGTAETSARKKQIEEIGVGEAKSITEFNNQMSDMQTGFGSRSLIVDGLRDTLTTAESGRFAEFKSDLINAAASLGLANADQIEQAADIQTAMKYFAQSILDSGMKDKIGPQISNADLMLVAKGQGTVENLAAANRNILGAMYGKLLYDRAKVSAWDDFVEGKGGLANISSSDRRKWEREFGEKNSIMEFVKKGKADTPVAGELSVKRDPSYFKEGWKYVDPQTGRVFIVKGFKEVNGKKVPDAEFVN